MTPGQKFALFLVALGIAALFSLVAEVGALYTLMIDDNPSEDAVKAAWAIFPSVFTGWIGLVAGWKLD
jgi:hypothetical protein